MKITDIKQQVRDPSRFSVSIDGKFSFGIDQSTLLEQKLRIGTEIDQQRLKELQTSADFGKWYMKCIDKLYRRPHSEKEMRDYLRRKDKQDIADDLIEKLHDRKKLDDRAFAEWFIEGRRRAKNRSTQILKAELSVRGIARDIINELLADTHDDDINALRLLIEKKRRLSRYQDETKLIQFLARQGFRYDDIKQALAPEDA